MAKLTIEIPDELALALATHPLPLPPADYCRRALEDAAARAQERRVSNEALIAQIEAVQDESHRALSMEEASKQLHVSLRTISRMINDGRLPSIKVGRYVRIPHEAVVRNRPHGPA